MSVNQCFGEEKEAKVTCHTYWVSSQEYARPFKKKKEIVIFSLNVDGVKKYVCVLYAGIQTMCRGKYTWYV